MRVRSVTPKPGYTMDGGQVVPVSNVVPFNDGALANIMTGRGTSVDKSSHNFWHFNPMPAGQIAAAYRGSWLMRKVIDIPAQDMTRAGRDWDANEADIEKVEAEEVRLGLWAKLLEAVTLGRLGGGAIVMGLGDDASQPLPANIRPGGLQYLTVLSRWQLTLADMDTDPASPLFGQPAYFMLAGTRSQTIIHPSRVICFKGQSVPSIQNAPWADTFWGDSIVQGVNEAVSNALTASGGFAALIDEAKLDIYKFDQLIETLAREGGQAMIEQRIGLTNTGKSTHRAIALDKEDEWDQRQVTWAGMPDVIKTYYSIVAGAADIPATRLLGKSADGLNATGEGDERNYNAMIAAKQEMDLRPNLFALDAVLLPSAGVKPGAVWKFSPLGTLSEKDEADIENKEADTVSKLVVTGLIPETAMAKVVQNRMIESGRWPGMQDALDEAVNDPEPVDDPSALVATAP